MKPIILTILLSLLVSIQSHAMKIKSGNVNFLAIGKPGFLKIRGHSNGSSPVGEFSIGQEGLNGQVAFNLKSLDTGIGLRNEHMTEKYLEVKKYPTATLTINNLKVSKDDLIKNQSKRFKGILNLHGVSKEIDGDYHYLAKDRSLKANFEILVSDFSINIPKYLGVMVSEKVQVEVKMALAE